MKLIPFSIVENLKLIVFSNNSELRHPLTGRGAAWVFLEITVFTRF